MKPENITLYFKSGGSDKVYQASLEQSGDLWVANFAYGRRGNTLTTGTKTQKPVSYEVAKKAYEAAIKSKTSKGYTVGESGTPYQFTDKESRDSGLHPQLLNPITDEELEALLDDEEHCLSEKLDGKRIILSKTSGKVVGVNRLGLTVGIPSVVSEQARLVSPDDEDFIFDGEMVGDTYFVFDCLLAKGQDCRKLSYKDRYNKISETLALFAVTDMGDNIKQVVAAKAPGVKRKFFQDLKSAGKEGVVFKKLSAPYTAGRPHTGGDQLKYKFVEDATCVVITVNAKRSVALGVIDEHGTTVSVGNVTIPPNHDIPKKGDIVSVRYLYAYKGGCLYQPVYQGLRDDQTIEDCKQSQLKYKAENE